MKSNPTPPRPVDTAVAKDFSDGRIQTTLSLDDGYFQAVPAPSNAQPTVTADAAFCNLLAGATSNNFSVEQAATENGLSFGLAVVTVADSVLKPGPQTYLFAAQERTASLSPYHARLAWIAVIEPVVESSCPEMPAEPSAKSILPQPRLPGYQILAIDADTGADGIIYSAKTNALCGGSGYRAAEVAPAVEFVSEPWTLIKRGPGPQSAIINYQRRSCDVPSLSTFATTGEPVVLADREHAGLVSVSLERVLASCGPAVATPLLLRSSTLATDLPQQLVHAPVGAQDVVSD